MPFWQRGLKESAGAATREVAHGFPRRGRVKLGKELTRVQMGLQPRDGTWLTPLGEVFRRSAFLTARRLIA